MNIGHSAHTDTGSVTILFPKSWGLQILYPHSGSWIRGAAVSAGLRSRGRLPELFVAEQAPVCDAQSRTAPANSGRTSLLLDVFPETEQGRKIPR